VANEANVAKASFGLQIVSLTLMKLSPLHLMAVLTDVTQQVQVEQALVASDRRLMLALDVLQVGEWEIDLQSGAVLHSAQHDRLFGCTGPAPAWTLNEVLSRVHPEDLDRVTHSLQAAVAGLHPWRVEFRIRWPDASVHWLAAHGHVESADGRPLRLFALLVDTTDQRLADADREHARALETENRQVRDASRMKSEFLANMSHELRTPLNAIIGFSELLQRGTVLPASPKHGQFLAHISKSGHHLLQLINDVLDVAKIESGKFEFLPQAIDLAALVGEVVGALQTASHDKQQSVGLELDPALEGLVLDPLRLRQVLFNYLSNAIKFTPAGGAIQVRARAAGAHHFSIEVEDNGPGIAGADLGQLFVEFSQLDSSYSKQHAGTGLGLALTRRLVEGQGGRVGVRSDPGVCTVFHAVLNRVHGWDAQQAAAPAPVAAADSGHADRLLVLEPDTASQRRLIQGLSAAGLQVDAATTAEQGLRLAQVATYDAIALGLQASDTAGLAALAGIRNGGPSQDSPVVEVSVAVDGQIDPDSPGHAVETARFAITNVLSKPIRGHEVQAALARLPQPAGRRARIVVVDDDPLAVDLMCATLTSHGMQAIGVTDSRTALDALAQHSPDALILDLMMPGMDGFEVLAALRAVPDWRDLPVFIWTSTMLTDAEYATLSRSARSILVKGGGGLPAMLDDLRRWRLHLPATVAGP
jgi:signal transduction histidine kinase/DNA-binding response OmpR family regulator